MVEINKVLEVSDFSRWSSEPMRREGSFILQTGSMSDQREAAVAAIPMEETMEEDEHRKNRERMQEEAQRAQDGKALMVETKGKNPEKGENSSDAVAVANQMESLRITARERAKMVAIDDEDLEEADEDLSEAIMCKILTPKSISPEMFKTFMPKIWNIEGRIRIKTMGKNIFRCNFNQRKDKERILRGP